MRLGIITPLSNCAEYPIDILYYVLFPARRKRDENITDRREWNIAGGGRNNDTTAAG